MRDFIKEILSEIDEQTIILDGLDSAVIGITYNNRLIYDYDKMVGVFVERDGMTQEEAEEWIYVNIEGSYFGENNPIVLHKI